MGISLAMQLHNSQGISGAIYSVAACARIYRTGDLFDTPKLLKTAPKPSDLDELTDKQHFAKDAALDEAIRTRFDARAGGQWAGPAFKHCKASVCLNALYDSASQR
jgi:hypothetical protein